MTRRSSPYACALRRFGRRAPRAIARDPAAVGAGLVPDDVRLFALTFAGGFLFVAVYLA